MAAEIVKACDIPSRTKSRHAFTSHRLSISLIYLEEHPRLENTGNVKIIHATASLPLNEVACIKIQRFIRNTFTLHPYFTSRFALKEGKGL